MALHPEAIRHVQSLKPHRIELGATKFISAYINAIFFISQLKYKKCATFNQSFMLPAREEVGLKQTKRWPDYTANKPSTHAHAVVRSYPTKRSHREVRVPCTNCIHGLCSTVFMDIAKVPTHNQLNPNTLL
jgi:hypothetical protein